MESKYLVTNDTLSILDSFEKGFLQTDTKGKIINANRAIAKMCGYKSAKEIIGLPIKTLYANPKERDQIVKALTKKNKLVNRELELKRKNGTTFCSLNIVKLFYDKKGNQLGTETVIRDHTEMQQTRESLEHANQQLSSSEQQLKASNQQLVANEQQLRAANQQLSSSEQQLKASNQQLVAGEQQLKAANQQLSSSEQQLKASNQQLVAGEQQLKAANQQLEANNQQLIASEQEIRKQAHDLTERAKELRCFYNISESVRSRETMEEILQDTANIIATSWQYPEITRGKVSYDGKAYVSQKFRKTKWYQSADLVINNEIKGSIEIFYLKKRPEQDEGPFLKEERKLIEGIAKNISETIELKHAEKAVREINERYHNLLNSLGTGVVLHAPDTRILLSNPIASEILGITQEQMEGKKAIDPRWRFVRTDGTDMPLEEYPVNKVLRLKKSFSEYVIGIKRPDRKHITWVDVNASIVFDKNKKAKYVTISFNDITERRQAEQAREVSEEKFSKAFQTNSSLMAISTIETGKFVDVNNAFSEVLGYKKDEIIGKTSKQLQLYDKQSPRNEIQALLKKHGSVKDSEIYVKTKDGESICGLFSAEIIQLKNGSHLLSVMTDITERKRAEQALEESERKRNIWIDNSPICTKVIDLDFNLQFMSAAGIRELKISDVTKYYGKPYPLHFFPDSFKTLVTDSLKKVKKTGESIKIEGQIGDIKGNKRWYQHDLVPVNDNNGKLDYILIISMDINERNESEIELTKSKEKAEESDRLKSAFLANMSHEIRTPMNGILGFTGLLKTPDLLEEKREKFIEIIEKSGDRLLNTVNDIIDISRIDAGQVEVSRTDVNIFEEMESQFEFFYEEAAAKGIELKLIKNLTKHGSFMLTDQVKLNSIVSNLIKNAIKYTDKGNIEIVCNKKRSKLEFKVTDTGIGIPKNRIQSIFNRFEQADIDDVHARQGSGLGLSITKAYVEMMGGHIWVESKPKKGSIFYFTLPWIEKQEKQVLKKGKKASSTESDSEINILIAEDDDASFEHLSIILTPVAKSIVRVSDGKEAIKHIKNNTKVNLVLMDINMPVMDGHEATKQIRKFNKEVVIIAQTAYALGGDERKSLNAGCNDYVPKPINRSYLLELISKYLGK